MAVYDAFVSYSHAKDKPVAAALQSVVQKLGKPWYRRRALRIFCDDTSLSATPSLWPAIEQALAQSRFLILLASPEAAASQWVNKEVAYWLEREVTPRRTRGKAGCAHEAQIRKQTGKPRGGRLTLEQTRPLGYIIIMGDRERLQSVAETSVFSADIDGMLSSVERDAVITDLARRPDGGDLIPGTGGLRKRRIALPGRGKRGGARVITLYLGERLPVYAVFVFAKNEREDLSPAQKRVLLRVVADIKAQSARTRP